MAGYGFGTQFGVGAFGLDGSGYAPSYYSWSPIINDSFDDGTLPSLMTGGVGSWTEETSGGGILWYSVPYGTDCDWWPTVGGSPQYRHCRAAYYSLGTVSTFKQVVVELQLHDFGTVDSNYTAWVFGLWQADNNMVWIYGHDKTTVRAHTVYSSSQTYLGDISFPSGTIIGSKVRFIWDRVFGRFFFEAWDAAHSQWVGICDSIAAGITPTRVLLGGKNWGSNFPSYTASFDSIYAYGIIDSRFGLTPGRTDISTEPTATALGQIEGAWDDRSRVVHHGWQFPASIEDRKSAEHWHTNAQRTMGWDDDSTISTHDRKRHPVQVDNPLPRVARYLDGDPRISPAAGGTFRTSGNVEGGVGAFADEDKQAARLTDASLLDFRRNTYDIDGHLHVAGEHFWAHGFFYDTTGEPWDDPEDTLLTGYARSGYYYLNGVNQGSLAPWASESSGAHRSARPDFPTRSIIAINRNELTIYDLDSFPAQFRVWMRFLLGDVNNFYLLGRVAASLTSCCMRNGVLVVTSKHNGTENGGLFIVNFKANDQQFVHLIRNDDHWIGVTGRNITHRNTTGNHTTSTPSPEFRVGPTNLWRSDVYIVPPGEAPDGNTGEMIAVGGEGSPPDVFRYYNSRPMVRTTASGDNVGGSGSAPRCVCFDDYGLFYFTDGDNTVFRNIKDYYQRVILAQKTEPRCRWTTLDYPIWDLKHLKDQIYAGAGALGADPLGGVYRIERADMSAWKAYTCAGGGGGGRLNAPPAGELLVGDDSRVHSLQGINLDLSSYLAVATWTGSAITLIRLFDDVVIRSLEWNGPSGHNLADPVAYEAFIMSR